MSGLVLSTENKFDAISVESIIKQIKESQQNVLKAFEEHNTLVNKSLELLNSHRRMNINGEFFFEKNTVEKVFVKVKDPLEEIKKLKKEFDSDIKYLDTEENRKKYETLNLKQEVLYPDNKNYYLNTIIDILCLYNNSKISSSFKEIFMSIFNATLPANYIYRFDEYDLKVNSTDINKNLKLKAFTEHQTFMSKEEFELIKLKILKVRDIRWLLLEMEKYPQFFQFTEDDLTIMKENGASRDNIYLVKKFLKKDGDYEEMYEEEEGGGIKLQYHMTGGSLNGEYKEYYPDGNLKQETSYKYGLKDGYESVFMNNGDRVMESEYKEDKLHGEHKRYFQNRLILHSHYKNGILDGEYKGFNMMSGILEEHCFYKDGKLEGEWVRYINGKLNILSHYKEGKLHGKYTEYKEDGTYLKECFYTEDKLINLRTYNTSGHLELKKSLINYDTYELTRYYECDGKIQDKVIMEGDKWNGEYKSWWHNGNKCVETTYKDDMIHGDYTYWNEDGTLREKLMYKDGVIV